MLSPSPKDNRILAGLPPEDYERIAHQLNLVALELKQVVIEPQQPFRDIYFPVSALISVLHVLEDGRSIEVGLIGREGVVGLRTFLTDHLALSRFIAQVPGDVYRMNVEAFQREARRPGSFQDLLFRYTNAVFFQLSQWVACNTLHNVEQRCCRWLMLVRDRIHCDQFPLTHDFLAHLLGVRRASVTETARTLQRKGLIRYRRGELTILDPQGLEAAACECYRRVKFEFDRMFG